MEIKGRPDMRIDTRERQWTHIILQFIVACKRQRNKLGGIELAMDKEPQA